MASTAQLLARIKKSKKSKVTPTESEKAHSYIERLKASRLEAEKQDYESAVERGKQWAKTVAEWKELVAVASLDESYASFTSILDAVEVYGYSADSLLDEFCHSYDGDEVSDPEAGGFVVGARSILEEVEAA
jgi:hypothetical protein